MGFKHTTGNGLAGNTTPFQLQVATLSLAAASGNQVLAAGSYESPVLVVSGAMTADCTIIYPATLGGTALVYNKTTAKELYCKVGGGTAFLLKSGLNIINFSETNAGFLGVDIKQTIALADANTVLTLLQSQASYLSFTGTLTAGRDVTFSCGHLGLVWIKNATGQTLTLKQAAATQTIANATTKAMYITATTIEVLN